MPAEHLSESFRAVPGFPRYRVSDLGRVQSWSAGNKKKGRPARWQDLRLSACGPKGHLLVRFYRGGKPAAACYAHALVLELFVGPRPAGMECCHNDGNPRNNLVGNLRWDTHRNNMADRTRHGTENRGEQNGGAKLGEADVREILRLRSAGVAQKEVASRFRVTPSCVSQIEHGNRWRHLHPERDRKLAAEVMEKLG